MDPSVTQLLAERLGISKEDFDHLQTTDPASFLASRFSDPLMAALFSTMLRQNTFENEVSEEQVDYEQVLENARETIRELQEELQVADKLLTYIARLTGYCPVCLGLNKRCLHCNGAHRAGSHEPMEEELLAWTKPALKRLGLRVVKVEE